MERTQAATLVAAVLVVLAGCAGGPPGSVASGGGDDAAPAAQAGTPEGNETTADGNESGGENATADGRVELPPGVSLDGVTNASALVEAHRQALARSGYSFVLRSNLSSAFAGGVDQWVVLNGTVAAGLSPFRLRSVSRVTLGNGTADRADRTDQPVSVSDAWGNESAVVVRSSRDDLTQVQRVDRSATGGFGPGPDGPAGPGGATDARGFDGLLTQASVVETVLRSATFEVTDVSQVENLTMVTLNATEFDEGSLGSDRNVSTFRASLVVDEDGRVHSLDYLVSFEDAEGPAVRYRYRLTDVGDAEVRQPSWVDRAFEPVRTNVSMETVGDRAIRLANDGDGTLPAGSTVRLRHDGETMTFQLDRALRPGEAVFLSVDATGEMRLATDGPPADASPLSGDYRVVVRSPGGQVVFQGQIAIRASE